ncbi:MAG: GxxExxY protein [Candidatus Stygibacter australis]|nr:GxxExxY protein [Candidatus Stygibacter australis]MDP8323455.1 GxxExxY protein [Candidatus Stygibacter australis]
MKDLIFEDESYKIRGAIFKVYTDMGCGFLEAVYQECLQKEFELSQIPFVAEHKVSLTYKGHQLKQVYYPDFICYEKIVVELKAVKALEDIHLAQVINYLKATGLNLGFLVNFNHYPKVDIKRIVL